MKGTQVLFKQHIGWNFKQLWKVKQLKRIVPTKASDILKEKNIPVIDPNKFLHPKKPFERVEVVGFKPKIQPEDETHPKWKARTCLTYKDDNVLLEGLEQAKLLTNTVEVQKGLPEKLQIKEVDNTFHELVKEAIMASHVFDAEQKKLPKIKDPLRPAFNFPRVYGITEQRVNKLLVARLLSLIERHEQNKIVRERYISNDVLFSFPFEKYGELVQLELTGDTLITSSQLLPPLCIADTANIELPSLYPVKETVTLTPQNIYDLQNIYPIDLSVRKAHPHTVFVHYHNTEIKNLFEEEVTETQKFGRSLLKTFTVAASYAKQRFGDNLKKLSEPITVQCIQTDGRLFHFGILQLNTLDLEETSVKNIWFQTPHIPLFETCRYEMGKPELKGYNSEAISHLLAFYNNL